MVSWFAGLFYIFRLYVYHVENWETKEVRQVLEVMERKLLKYIMLPSVCLTLVFGVWMFIQNPGVLRMPWMHIKLSAVLVLIMYHAYAQYIFCQFQNGRLALTSKQCRVINEIPTVVLIAVAVLVFLKPDL